MKPRKPKSEPSLVDQLAKPLRDIVDDIRAQGPDALRKVREESPSKYLQLATKLLPLVAALNPGPDDWSDCRSMEDIGRKLLKSAGLEDEELMTDDLVEAAIAENDAFIQRLCEIAAKGQMKELN